MVQALTWLEYRICRLERKWVVLAKDNGGFGPDIGALSSDLGLYEPDLGAARPSVPLVLDSGKPKNPPHGHCVVGCWIQLKPTE
jgi:hypothetical protein